MSTKTSLMRLESIRDVLVVALLFAGGLGASMFLFARAQAAPTTATAQSSKRVQAAAQENFSTPEDAVHALTRAVESKDLTAIRELFGSDYSQLLSGDRVEDRNNLAAFSENLQQANQLQMDTADKYTLIVGKEHWPMPIPIVRRDGRWVFDTRGGLEEILNRRIGADELSAITTCRAYVVAQWEYFTSGDHDNDSVAEYAQKFMSSPGTHDGLYWETVEGEPPSPLGTLVAEARAEGYGPRSRTRKSAATPRPAPRARDSSQAPRHPFHGYFFRILTSQGPHAPGGKYSYIINGNMIAGFALVAYPAKWGNSGVMTFIVSQQGRVYQKNLGPDTLSIASAMTDYDPDTSWQLVDTSE